MKNLKKDSIGSGKGLGNENESTQRRNKGAKKRKIKKNQKNKKQDNLWGQGDSYQGSDWVYSNCEGVDQRDNKEVPKNLGLCMKRGEKRYRARHRE